MLHCDKNKMEILRILRSITIKEYIMPNLKQRMMQDETLRKFAGKGMFFEGAIDRDCKYNECCKPSNL